MVIGVRRGEGGEGARRGIGEGQQQRRRMLGPPAGVLSGLCPTGPRCRHPSQAGGAPSLVKKVTGLLRRSPYLSLLFQDCYAPGSAISSSLPPGRDSHQIWWCGRDPSRAVRWYRGAYSTPRLPGARNSHGGLVSGRLGGNHFMKAMRRKIALVSLLSLPAMLVVATAGSATAAPQRSAARTCAVTIFFEPGDIQADVRRLGCDWLPPGCHLLTGPFPTPSTANLTPSKAAAAGSKDRWRVLPLLRPRVPLSTRSSSAITIPTVSCVPLRAGCDNISAFAGGATSVKGINAVDSAEQHHQHRSGHRAPGPGAVRG